MSTKIEIKHRSTGAVLWSGEDESLRAAVVATVKARAYLADAYLAGANLADADLSGADLSGAYLTDADLAGANLTRADLSGAYLAGAYLTDADLSGANLTRADLSRADLSGAYLSGADLSGANLADANLADADLSGADLSGAYLTGADLMRAYLADANLMRANLADADLTRADLSGADLTRADLSGADLTRADLMRANLTRARNVPDLATREEPTEPYARTSNRSRADYAAAAAAYRARHPEVPVVEDLDAKILAAIGRPGCSLDMGAWHQCETTHCRAGWAIHLAGKSGYDLEKNMGDPALAGRAIYRASTGRSPHFYATNERALADIRRCAEEDAANEGNGAREGRQDHAVNERKRDQ